MILNKRIRIQLALFTVVALAAGLTMTLGYIRVPALLFGAGQYQVRVVLPQSAGLYERSNVTYRGTEVGRVDSIGLTENGVEAVLALTSDIEIPSDLDAEVHSQSAIGEQYIALLPRDGSSPPLRDGDVIPQSRTSVPPNVNALLDATNRGLRAIPGDGVRTTVDEAYTAIGGLGPELARIVKGSTRLAIDARANLDSLTDVIDNVAPLLDTQTDTAQSISAAAAHLATITAELKSGDTAVQGILQNGPAAADAGRHLFDRLRPTLGIVLSNLVNIEQVAVTYHSGLEQILVLLPQGAATQQSIGVANKNTLQDYKGAFLSFNLNLNLPPPCTTGFLPPQQMRVPSDVDYPDRPEGDLYCRVPQDSVFNVRGARNLPCEAAPGKRAPTAAMCESDQVYVPLNDGYNWKGDPNATLSGQAVPQLPPGSPPAEATPPQGPAPPPMAAAEYDPANGTYVGPDGRVYTQSNLAEGATEEQTWQTMLLPPTGN